MERVCVCESAPLNCCLCVLIIHINCFKILNKNLVQFRTHKIMKPKKCYSNLIVSHFIVCLTKHEKTHSSNCIVCTYPA